MTVLMQVKSAALMQDASVILDAFEHPAVLLSADHVILASNKAYLKQYGPLTDGNTYCFARTLNHNRPCHELGYACPLLHARRTGRPETASHLGQLPDGPGQVELSVIPLLDDADDVAAFIEVIKPRSAPLVGHSKAVCELLSLLSHVAPTGVPVLLMGEAGSGKRQAAKMIHDQSEQRLGPFIPVDCKGLSERLLESVFFGAPADSEKPAQHTEHGVLEAAAGGTLYLNDVEALPPPVQMKLLRVLESSSYRPTGQAGTRPTNFRLICGTTCDLAAMVENGAFRGDLYFTINTFPLRLPALGERLSDLPSLSEAILAPHKKRLSPSACRVLQQPPAPDSMQACRQLLETAAALTTGDIICAEVIEALKAQDASTPKSIAPKAHQAPAFHPSSREIRPIDDVVNDYVRWANVSWEGDRKALSERLDISERTLYRRLKAVRTEED